MCSLYNTMQNCFNTSFLFSFLAPSVRPGRAALAGCAIVVERPLEGVGLIPTTVHY